MISRNLMPDYSITLKTNTRLPYSYTPKRNRQGHLRQKEAEPGTGSNMIPPVLTYNGSLTTQANEKYFPPPSNTCLSPTGLRVSPPDNHRLLLREQTHKI